MIEAPRIGLRIVGPDDLDQEVRRVLKPGEIVRDRHGNERRLPSHFFEVPSWEAALATQLAPNFGLWEMIDVDVREAEPMRMFPRYVPCAIAALAAQLQILRSELGKVVRIAANGGYRSPSHELSEKASPHAWGTAANIYRVGEEWLETEERIERYRAIARRVMPATWTRPAGSRPGFAFDHLHIDLGYAVVEPHHSRPDGSDDTTAGGS